MTTTVILEESTPAELISAALRHPDMPTEMYNRLSEVIMNFYTDNLSSKDRFMVDTDPAYIASIFNAAKSG